MGLTNKHLITDKEPIEVFKISQNTIAWFRKWHFFIQKTNICNNLLIINTIQNNTFNVPPSTHITNAFNWDKHTSMHQPVN
jgi:hypothetical protein